MNKLKEKQNKIKLICYKNGVKVGSRWLNKYLYYYAKCTPLTSITMSEALDVILKNPDNFVSFIYGARAEFINNKKKLVRNKKRL